MPKYDYKCTVCGITQEIYKEFGDDSVPVCCQQSMERVWSAVPTHFKTGGFYSTGG